MVFGLLKPTISASIDLHCSYLEVTHLDRSDRKWWIIIQGLEDKIVKNNMIEVVYKDKESRVKIPK